MNFPSLHSTCLPEVEPVSYTHLDVYKRQNEDRTRALVEGFNLHMVKPVEPAALVKAVIDLAGHVDR